jgi:SAM-dependent methyltransferase
MAPGWDDRHAYFEGTARPVTERMLELLAPSRGPAILDLAAGTGVVGFAAAGLVGLGGRVIVSDFSEAMVEAAERHASKLGLENVECRVLDAERLDLPDDAVDGVLCAGAPGILALADLDRLRHLFADAGFSDSRIDKVAFTWRFPNMDEYWRFLTGAAGAIALVVSRLEADEREHVREEIAERVRPFAGGDGIELPPRQSSHRRRSDP